MKKTPYPSRKSLAKLSLSEVVARLLAMGNVNLGRRRLRQDDPDPFLRDCPTVEQQIDQRLRSYEHLARHALFSNGVRGYVEDLPICELNAQLKSRHLSTDWSDRRDSRQTKEQALIGAILKDE